MSSPPPAIVLLEFSSIAVGIQTGDAMVKRALLETLHAGTVQPGKYLVLAGGQVAEVEEALEAGRAVGGAALLDEIFLPEVHRDVVRALTGVRMPGNDDALGVIETRGVPATIAAADAAVKGARVTLATIRLADGLGGKAYALVAGELSDVEAAVELGVGRLTGSDQLVAQVIIPRLHEEMRSNLELHPEFVERVRTYEEPAR